MCAAPGGFLSVAVRVNPGCEVVGFSLPRSGGGYPIIPGALRDRVKHLDVTMLAEDMGVTAIPADHPDAGKFLSRRLEETQLFDLVICDGHVLRPHAQFRSSYRESREGARLKTAQLAIGLQHLKPGGTAVVLLHKVEAWETVSYFRRFSKFSSVRLYKPAGGHGTRSSFYMVATGVNREHPEAGLAIDAWKRVWRTATFGTDEEYKEALRAGEPSVEQLLDEFGPVLTQNGRSVWEQQAKFLAKASFTQK